MKYHILVRLPYLSILVALFLLFALAGDKWVSSLQSSTCVPTRTPRWRQCATVYCSFDSTINNNQTVKSQLRDALSLWTTANTSNDSRVKFVLGSPPSGSISPSTLDFFISTETGGAPAYFQPIAVGTDGALLAGFININLQAALPCGGTGPTFNQNVTGYDKIFLKTGLHEIGHTMGLDEADMPGGSCCPQTDNLTVMNGPCGTNDSAITNGKTNMPVNVQPCDNDTINVIYPPPSCGGGGGFEIVVCLPDRGEGFAEQCSSPIVIDTQGNGFDLTNASNGVDFDIDGDGLQERLAWTSQGSDDTWLVLDRNFNQIIDDGTEMFGNFTPQPSSAEPQGFLALAEFDKITNGGNRDGFIDNRDHVFQMLRLWLDSNHNGVSELAELYPLPSFHIASLDLSYKEKKRRDEHENWFRYRARVRDERGAQVGRWAWDVFLVRLR